MDQDWNTARKRLFDGGEADSRPGGVGGGGEARKLAASTVKFSNVFKTLLLLCFEAVGQSLLQR